MKRHTTKKNTQNSNTVDNQCTSGVKYEAKEFLLYDDVTMEWYEFFYTFTICCCLGISVYSINLDIFTKRFCLVAEWLFLMTIFKFVRYFFKENEKMVFNLTFIFMLLTISLCPITLYTTLSRGAFVFITIIFVIYLYIPLIPNELHTIKFICQLSISITEGIIFSFFISEDGLIVDTTQTLINIVFLSGILIIITFYKWILETSNYITPILECNGSWEIIKKDDNSKLFKHHIQKWKPNINYYNDVIVEYNGQYYKSIGKYNKIVPDDALQNAFYFIFMYYHKTQFIVKWMFVFLICVLFVITWNRNNYWDCMIVLLGVAVFIQILFQLFISFFVSNEELNIVCLESQKIE